MSDNRYCYGATCTWHGPISEVVKGWRNIPGCPHCEGPLFQMDSKEEWDARVQEFKGIHELPHYSEWLDTLIVGKCIPLKGWDWKKSYQEFVNGLNKSEG